MANENLTIKDAEEAYDMAVDRYDERCARRDHAGRVRRLAYNLLVWSAQHEVLRTGEELNSMVVIEAITGEHPVVVVPAID